MSRSKTLKKELKEKVRIEQDQENNYAKGKHYDDLTDALYHDDYTNAPELEFFSSFLGKFNFY